MGTLWTLDDFADYAELLLDNTWSYLGREVVPCVANTHDDKSLYHGPMSNVPLDR